MNGVSFSATTENKKGILLDPRTKLVLLLTITTLMFSTSNEGIMNIVKPCLSLVPFMLILSERRFKTAGKYLLLYVACFVLERIALVHHLLAAPSSRRPALAHARVMYLFCRVFSCQRSAKEKLLLDSHDKNRRFVLSVLRFI